MKTALVFFADGFEEIEALSPVDYLRRAGVEVGTVSIKSSLDKSSSYGPNFVTSSHNITLKTDYLLSDILEKNEMPDCVILPGGSVGADNLSNCKELLDFFEKVWDNGKIVAAICASPAVVLGKTKIPNGKRWTCYPGMESESKEEYIKNYVNEVVVTDGNLVTSRGPGASEQFAMELVKIIAGEETYTKIRKGTQQR